MLEQTILGILEIINAVVRLVVDIVINGPEVPK